MPQQTTNTIEINGIELEEGDTLFRFAALRTYQTISEQDPDSVILEIAEALTNHHPDVVNNAPADIVAANLRGTPGVYDECGVLNYHAMEITNIDTVNGYRSVTINDLKEQIDVVFQEREHSDSLPEDGYGTVFESFDVLEAHLGVTIHPVSEVSQ
jgi:hypothetical protein